MGGSRCSRCGDFVRCTDLGGGIWNTVKNFLRGESSSSGRSISREDSYDPEKAALMETAKINRYFLNFREKCQNTGEKLEKNVLRESRIYLDDLIGFLRNINNKRFGNQRLDINIYKIERDNRETEDKINGYISKYIQKKVSLDNDECLEILKLDPGNEKERKMTDFMNKALKEGIENLSKELDKSLKEQIEEIEEQIENRISTFKYLSNDKMKKFNEIKEIKKNGEFEIETDSIIYSYKLGMCGIAKKIIEDDKWDD